MRTCTRVRYGRVLMSTMVKRRLLQRICMACVFAFLSLYIIFLLLARTIHKTGVCMAGDVETCMYINIRFHFICTRGFVSDVDPNYENYRSYSWRRFFIASTTRYIIALFYRPRNEEMYVMGFYMYRAQLVCMVLFSVWNDETSTHLQIYCLVHTCFDYVCCDFLDVFASPDRELGFDLGGLSTYVRNHPYRFARTNSPAHTCTYGLTRTTSSFMCVARVFVHRLGREIRCFVLATIAAILHTYPSGKGGTLWKTICIAFSSI